MEEVIDDAGNRKVTVASKQDDGTTRFSRQLVTRSFFKKLPFQNDDYQYQDNNEDIAIEDQKEADAEEDQETIQTKKKSIRPKKKSRVNTMQRGIIGNDYYKDVIDDLIDNDDEKEVQRLAKPSLNQMRNSYFNELLKEIDHEESPSPHEERHPAFRKKTPERTQSQLETEYHKKKRADSFRDKMNKNSKPKKKSRLSYGKKKKNYTYKKPRNQTFANKHPKQSEKISSVDDVTGRPSKMSKITEEDGDNSQVDRKSKNDSIVFQQFN